ncbi:MAG: HDIG domain-containing protein [Bdellovibrionaceae bacterium]|nr:HDIG domain-containing protein [Pseudobdellovibrionaceae bacterium]
MYIIDFSYIFFAGLVFGLLLTVIWDYLEKRILLRKTKIQADQIIQEAQVKKEDHFRYIKKESLFDFDKRISEFEKEKEKILLNFRKVQSQIDKKRNELDLKQKENSWKIKEWNKNIDIFKKEITNLDDERKQLRQQLEKSISNRKSQLEKVFSIDKSQIKSHLEKNIKEEWIDEIKAKIKRQEEYNKQNLQKDSFFQINQVLNRINRTYCPERGIRPVLFKNKRHLDNLTGKNNKNISEIEKECGVDIVINQDDLSAFVFGIDPVRRELGRMSLLKLSESSKIDSSSIKLTVKTNKKNLFSKIHFDGSQICKKLGLKNVSTEIKNMLGALRYRYSFAQNQYFHCEEVGWLCGLLNAEMSLPIEAGKRSGLFHDIGKAMDHSIEGNHAVIGAEFLSKYNENKEILHAVRAHHYDETPSTPLAYLVIVADSISGSRPGARRFTEDSYNQKMLSLEKIINSFKNIEDAYIMNAGREMRVIVNNEKVNDQKALDLSKLIARKIEKECSYPGLIKVTVVRHSETVATA